MHKYKLFKMDNNQTISEIFTRLTDIVNYLKALGRDMPNLELVNKILRSLPQNSKPKVTAISEAKDLRKLVLSTHQITDQERNDQLY